MRIVFVSANRETLPDPVVPLGLLSVMGATPAGHERHLVDLCFEQDPVGAIGERLRSLKPDLVAIGLRNVQSSDYAGTDANLAYYGELAAAVRAATSAPLVVGGGAFSVMPRTMMDRLRPDFGVEGEGEVAWPMLVDALASGGPVGAIPGLHRMVDGVSQAVPRTASFPALDSLPPPDRTAADPRYFEQTGTANIQTKRGCPLLCSYCTYPQIEGRAVRMRSPAAVAGEMRRTAAMHPAVRHFFIVDSVFNVPPDHAAAVCDAMVDAGLRIPWTCYATPLGFTRTLADKMVRAGCAGAEIGTDSGCDEVLQRLRKGFDTAAVRRMARECRDAGLPDCHTFVLGTPGESLDDVRRSLDFVVDLDPFAAILMIWTDDASAGAPADPARVRLRGEIEGLLRERAEDFPRWIVPSLRIHYDLRVFAVLRRRGVAGPLWEQIKLVAPTGGRRTPPRPRGAPA